MLTPGRRRPSVGSWLLLIGALAVFLTALRLNYFWSNVGRRHALLPYAGCALAVTVFLLRRRPGRVLAVLLVVAVWVSLTEPDPTLVISSYLVVGAALGRVAVTQVRRRAAVLAAVVLLLMALVLDRGARHLLAMSVVPVTEVLVILSAVTVWTIGSSIRQRREYAESLRSQAMVQAVTAERLRIARELHDVVAHSIGVIAIQAGMGSRVIDTQPAEARLALQAIENTSRQTLLGLRSTLGTLRQGTGTGDEPPLLPAPGLAELDSLVASTGQAGVRVDVEWPEPRRSWPADVELSAFRIVQEAVTNVVRHSGADRCWVRLTDEGDELVIEVVDRGRPGIGAAVTAGPDPAPGSRYGIIGMRERVAMLHGQFQAGPSPDGGFAVTARLPRPSGRP